MNGNFSIEARSHNIAGLWSHNYWVLRDQGGRVVAELHGLATDRYTGKPVAVGTSERHSLRAWHFISAQDAHAIGLAYENTHKDSGLYRDGQLSKVVISAPATDVLPRWRAAVKTIAYINKMNLDYPPGGFKILGRTRNSNSMFTTFADLMGVGRHSFWGVFEPGISNPVLYEDQVEGLQGLSGEFWDGEPYAPSSMYRPPVPDQRFAAAHTSGQSAPAPQAQSQPTATVMFPDTPRPIDSTWAWQSERAPYYGSASHSTPPVMFPTDAGHVDIPYIEYRDASGVRHRYP
ncbi:hypothetical protein [Pseudomonas sp. UBA4194]|uniref:hypothetical protein n=1 Tax=Pseudomonas sp. UBA4194 TaxID=1947317 RepID=UPI0025DFA365|nr:hypothetical protein [Pseudomonas sp. UBA4194]